MAAVPFTEEDLHELYMWVDEIPISRSKRNIARDFADGCCVAEIVKFFFPKIVELHNYVPAMNLSKKRDNWATLNAKVFRKLYFEVPSEEIEDIIAAVPGAVERFLRALRIKISQIKSQREERYNNNINNNAGWAGTTGIEDGRGDEYDGPMDGYYNAGSRHPRTAPGAGAGAAPMAATTSGNGNATGADGPAGGGGLPPQQQRLLNEKERTIIELRETVGILSEKIMKLEELVKVKDEKLNQYRAKFGKA